MKHHTLFLFLFTATFAFGQYQPLLEEDKFWDLLYWSPESITLITGGSRIEIDGDTILNNIKYKKLKGTGIISGQSDVFGGPFTLAQTSGLIGIMREDTIEQKI